MEKTEGIEDNLNATPKSFKVLEKNDINLTKVIHGLHFIISFFEDFRSKSLMSQLSMSVSTPVIKDSVTTRYISMSMVVFKQ